MSLHTISATAVPRYLLPQSSWCSRAVKPAALGALEARRHHRSSSAPRCRANLPVATTLQQQCIRQWRRQPSALDATDLSPSIKSRRHFSATAPQLKDHHFDTLKFVQRLKDEGFTEEQAEGMMKVLGDVIEERYICITCSNLLRLSFTASKTSHARWSSAKTKSAQPTPKKSTSPNCAPNL